MPISKLITNRIIVQTIFPSRGSIQKKDIRKNIFLSTLRGMYEKIGVPLKTKKNYNLTRPDKIKKFKTNKIYSKKEITAKNKTAKNTATPQAMVLNPYVTKTLYMVNKLKNTSITTRPPLKTPHTPYQSMCNSAIEWKNANKQKEYRTICTTQLSDRDKSKM